MCQCQMSSLPFPLPSPQSDALPFLPKTTNCPLTTFYVCRLKTTQTPSQHPESFMGWGMQLCRLPNAQSFMACDAALLRALSLANATFVNPPSHFYNRKCKEKFKFCTLIILKQLKQLLCLPMWGLPFRPSWIKIFIKSYRILLGFLKNTYWQY